MKITDHISEVFCGYTFTYRYYESLISTKNTLIFAHGIGEVGPLDGSLLYKVAYHGYPMHAQNGFEFPFNIVAIQVPVSYSITKKFLLHWAKLRLGADVLGVTGLSLGGMYAYEQWHEDVDNLLDFVAPVCGKLDSKVIPQMREIPCSSWHGTLDTTVSYQVDLIFVNAYNSVKTLKIDWNPQIGVGHDVWDIAYSVTPGKDKLLQWIISRFQEKMSNSADVKQQIIDFINTLK